MRRRLYSAARRVCSDFTLQLGAQDHSTCLRVLRQHTSARRHMYH